MESDTRRDIQQRRQRLDTTAGAEDFRTKIAYIEDEAPKVPAPGEKIAAVQQVVALLEGYSDEARSEVLEIAKRLLAPTFDRHEMTMDLIASLHRQQETEMEFREAVARHRDGSSTQVRNVDRELWEAFGIDPPIREGDKMSR